MKRNGGFVLMETIVVISVLCVVLLVLYGAYSKMLLDVSSRSLHDNTEYIYKSEVLRDYLEDKIDIVDFMGTNFVSAYCSDQLSQFTSCTKETSLDGNDLFEFMGVKGIYFILWDKNTYTTGRYAELEPTTQQYINTIDAAIPSEAYRMMVVMYASENNYVEDEYEYAYLRFGSRG